MVIGERWMGRGNLRGNRDFAAVDQKTMSLLIWLLQNKGRDVRDAHDIDRVIREKLTCQHLPPHIAGDGIKFVEQTNPRSWIQPSLAHKSNAPGVGVVLTRLLLDVSGRSRRSVRALGGGRPGNVPQGTNPIKFGHLHILGGVAALAIDFFLLCVARFVSNQEGKRAWVIFQKPKHFYGNKNLLSLFVSVDLPRWGGPRSYAPSFELWKVRRLYQGAHQLSCELQLFLRRRLMPLSRDLSKSWRAKRSDEKDRKVLGHGDCLLGGLAILASV